VPHFVSNTKGSIHVKMGYVLFLMMLITTVKVVNCSNELLRV